MYFEMMNPPESLKPFVRAFWIFEGNFGAQEYIYRSVADVCPEMIFHYKGLFKNSGETGNPFYSGLHAQSKQFSRYETNDPFGIFGVYLYPYATPLLFNISAHQATGELVDLPTLLGAEGKELEERMLSAPNNAKRLTIITSFLEKKLLNQFDEQPQAFSAIKYLIDTGNHHNIPAIAAMFCMTERTLQRHFKEYAGLNPVLLTRICRFKSTLDDYGNRNKLLTDIAHECGYYDQSHFISDFKSFSGYHPKEYFFGSPEGSDWR